MLMFGWLIYHRLITPGLKHGNRNANERSRHMTQIRTCPRAIQQWSSVRGDYVRNDDDSLARLYKCIFVFDEKKKRKLTNTRPSLHFYGMLILVKTKPLSIEMAWLPFQKYLTLDKKIIFKSQKQLFYFIGQMSLFVP